MFLLQNISKEIKIIDAKIKRLYNQRVNSQVRDEAYNKLLIETIETEASFKTLLKVAECPIDVEMFLQIRQNLIARWDYECSEAHQTVIDNLTAWTNSLKHFPKIICLCGSTRFIEAFQEANLQETLAGNIVLSVGCNTKSDAELFSDQNRDAEFEETKRKIDELHKRKIDLADEVFVLNVNGYIGESTRSEIEYAKATGKPIRYLEPWNAALDKAREEVQSNA